MSRDDMSKDVTYARNTESGCKLQMFSVVRGQTYTGSSWSDLPISCSASYYHFRRGSH